MTDFDDLFQSRKEKRSQAITACLSDKFIEDSLQVDIHHLKCNNRFVLLKYEIMRVDKDDAKNHIDRSKNVVKSSIFLSNNCSNASIDRIESIPIVSQSKSQDKEVNTLIEGVKCRRNLRNERINLGFFLYSLLKSCDLTI